MWNKTSSSRESHLQPWHSCCCSLLFCVNSSKEVAPRTARHLNEPEHALPSQSSIHFLPAVYHHNWFLPLTASAPALSEMTVQDVLETQSLLLLERSCENFAPIQNNKERLIISIWGYSLAEAPEERVGLEIPEPQPYQTNGHLYRREQLCVFDLSHLASGKRHLWTVHSCLCACTPCSLLWH